VSFTEEDLIDGESVPNLCFSNVSLRANLRRPYRCLRKTVRAVDTFGAFASPGGGAPW